MLRCGGQVEDFCSFAFLVQKKMEGFECYEHSMSRRMTMTSAKKILGALEDAPNEMSFPRDPITS